MTTCAQPITYEALVAWWAHDLPEPEVARVEEHLFACDSCAAAAEAIGRLAGGLRELIPPVISRAHRERLLGAGKRITFTPCEPNGTARALFAKDLDLLIHELKGDFRAADRVDLDILAGGNVMIALEDVPFDRERGTVLIACQRHYRDMPGGDPTFRVHVVEKGARKPPADYLVYHEWE
jgi:hypothetical protein